MRAWTTNLGLAVTLTVMWTPARGADPSGAGKPQPAPSKNFIASPADLKARIPEQLRITKPDYVVFVPEVTDEGVNDTGNEHFLVFDGPDGSLMAVWTQSSAEAQPDQHIAFARSTDEGRTWSRPRIIAGPKKPGDGHMASWGYPLVSRKGRIYVLYSQHIGRHDSFVHHTGWLHGISSDDNGRTWSRPQNVPVARSSNDNPDPDMPPNMLCWQKPLRLGRDGRYFAGFTRWTSFAVRKPATKSWMSADARVEFMRFENVDDNPAVQDLRISWFAANEKALAVPFPSHPDVSACQEPSIVKLPDGRLFCVMRTCSGSPFWSVSSDLGETWTQPRRLLRKDGGEPLLHPLSPCPMYDVGGNEAGSGRYALFIHSHDGYYQGYGPADSSYHRRPIYLVPGRFQPGADQPVWFDEPRFFMDHDGVSLGKPHTRGRLDLALYSSFTVRGGQPVLWYPERKFFLLGRRLPDWALGEAKPDAERRVCDAAILRKRPAGAPKASDVMMRSLRVHPANAKDPHDTLAAARNFHVTRLDWIPSLNAEFVEKANSQGMAVSASTSSSVPRLPDGQSEKFSLRDINGNRVCMVHKRGWPWNVEGCVNNPDYRKWYTALIFGFLDMGCAGLQRDEPGANLHATRLGGCFCRHCMAEFRRFLAGHTTPEQRRRLGIEPLEAFDYAAALRKAGAPAGDAFEKWDGGELKQLFIEFQLQSTVAFHREMRRAANSHADRAVPWSCNNGARTWDPPQMVFDYFIGELSVSRANPPYLHEVFRKAEQLGRAQVVTMPLSGNPIVDDDIRPVTRRTIATAYALGSLCMVPWDTYMPKDQPRYFGQAAAYADLYGFVRAVARYLDGYEYAGAFGKDLACDLYGQTPPLRLPARDGVYAFVRAVPGDRRAPVAIHLVDWSKQPVPFSLALNLNRLFGTETVRVRLLLPALYDATKHAEAEKKHSFADLVVTIRLELAAGTRLAIPALSPWGIVLVESAEGRP